MIYFGTYDEDLDDFDSLETARTYYFKEDDSTESKLAELPSKKYFTRDGSLTTIDNNKNKPIHDISENKIPDSDNLVNTEETGIAASTRKRNSNDGDIPLLDIGEPPATKPRKSHGSDHESDVPQHEIAFSIDHIFEKILTNLHVPDLLNCRLVCLKWKAFATPEIRKKVTLSFDGFEKHIKTHDALFIHKMKLDMLDMLQDLRLKNFEFLCNKFQFSVASAMEHEMLRQILNGYGHNIKELTLNLKHDEYQYDTLLHENVIMKIVITLIVRQAPNLEYLYLNVDTIVPWDDYDEDFLRQPLQKSDKMFKWIHQSKFSTWNNTNLKVVKFGPCLFSPGIVEFILHVSPNLNEVIPASFDSGHYDYLVEPLNRVYLLKKLSIDLNQMELLEDIANASQNGRIQLREIEFCLEHISHSQYEFYNPEFETRVVNIINVLLESSWNSIERILWRDVFCLSGLKWPEIMPRLWKLELGCRSERLERGDLIFPHGFSPSKAFPKLRKVCFFDFDQRAELVNCFGDEEKFTSVKDVCIYTDHIVFPRRMNDFHRVFPNANIYTKDKQWFYSF